MDILEFLRKNSFSGDLLISTEFESLLVFVRSYVFCTLGVDIGSDDKVFAEQVESLSRRINFKEDWNKIFLMLVNLRRFWNCEVASIDIEGIEALGRYFLR